MILLVMDAVKMQMHCEEHLLTNDGVLALLNAQRLDDSGDALHLLLLGHGVRQPQHGRIVQHLPHCQCLVQQVILQQASSQLETGRPCTMPDGSERPACMEGHQATLSGKHPEQYAKPHG